MALILLGVGGTTSGNALDERDAGRIKPKPPAEIGSLARAVETKDAADGDRLGTTMTRALKQADEAFSKAAEMGRRVALRFTDGGGPRTFVIPGESMAADISDGLSEDLAVMSRILEKVAGRNTGAGEPFAFLGGRWGNRLGRELDALYLDGFGALFLIEVDFPLVAPTEKKGEKAGEHSDRVWEEARNELQRRGGFGQNRTQFEAGLATEIAAFDSARVATLTRDVLRSLKHATNLRGLGEREWVLVSVFGPVTGVVKEVNFTPNGSKVAVTTGDSSVRVWDVATGETPGPGRKKTSVMTFRVRKSDIDDFAKGKTSAEAFETKVQIGIR